jgi:hypothetical protein
MKAVINAVTEADFGAATVVAAAVDEVEIAWATSPTATTTTDAVTLSGSTTVGGYVHCMVSKTGVSQTVAATPATRRLAEDAAATPEADTAAAEPAADTAAAEPAAAEPAAAPASSADPWLSMLTDDTHGDNYNFKRVETKDPFTFTLKFAADENSKYGWGCQATSLNPDAKSAAFRSTAVGGSATTAKTPVVAPSGDSALWSSFFAAIIMIVGVFFY